MAPRDLTIAPLRIVVVDDDEGIRTLLEVTASLDGRFDVISTAGSVADALAAIAAAGTDGIDLILLDVSLPDGDGIESVGQVRSAAPSARIAMFTGWSDDATIDRARAAGADAVFGKSGDPQRLLDELAALVD